jgi:beta-lactamase class A
MYPLSSQPPPTPFKGRKPLPGFYRWIAFQLVFAALLITGIQLVNYARVYANFPAGAQIGGVSIAYLNYNSAQQRLREAYGIPVELRYDDNVIHMQPEDAGFTLHMNAMLQEAGAQKIAPPFLAGFWNFLWNRMPQAASVPLQADISEERLRLYLQQEICARYDAPAVAPVPSPGMTSFKPGVIGRQVDLDAAVPLIEAALRSPNKRVVKLPIETVEPPPPLMENLKVLIRQTIDLARYDGLTEIYILDLETREELSFAYLPPDELPTGIAFNGASAIKIPIMISILRRQPEPPADDIDQLMQLMIKQSENTAADALMARVLDRNLGPIYITDDLQRMGFENTFLAGNFYIGAPLLRRYRTPANTRTDISTDPDVYNQTTPVDMGMLLDDIYQCANHGGGSLPLIFPAEITQVKCQRMINYLALNRISLLIQAGLPEGTRLATKHGWIIEYDGLLHAIGDMGIVFSPGSDYVMVIFLYRKVGLIFDPVNVMVSDISHATYSYFNPPTPITRD